MDSLHTTFNNAIFELLNIQNNESFQEQLLFNQKVFLCTKNGCKENCKPKYYNKNIQNMRNLNNSVVYPMKCINCNLNEFGVIKY